MDRGSELYSRFLAGDDAGLEQLITEYKDGLILYLHTLVGDLALAEELTEKISDTLSQKNVEGAIIMQELSAEEAAKDTAIDGISAGKAKLVEQILAQNSLHTYDELAKMSIQQLNLLRTEYYVNSESIQANGSPSTLAYIGKDEAIRISKTPV